MGLFGEAWKMSLELFADAQSIWGPVFNSIASHGIFGKCLKSLLERKLEGSLPSSLRPVPWLRSGHCPPNETPLWCLEDPYSMEEKGGVLTPALGCEEGASGKLGKAAGQSNVESPGFKETWQDPW